MTLRRWSQIAGWFTLFGSVAWFAKLTVIVATDGRIIETGPAAWLMSLGLVCLLLGSLGPALWLTRHLHSMIRLVAVLLSPVICFGSLVVLGIGTAAIVGQRGPVYLEAEAGIGVAATLWLVFGVVLLRQIRRTPDNTGRLLPHA